MSYEAPLDCKGVSPNVFIPLTEEEVETKMEAIWCYKSELERRSHFTRNAIRHALGYRGPFAYTEYVEAYELRILVASGVERND